MSQQMKDVSVASSSSSSLSSSLRRSMEDDLLHAGGISLYLGAAAMYPPKQEDDGCNLLDMVVLQHPRGIARGDMIVTTHVNLARTLPSSAHQECRNLENMFGLVQKKKKKKKKKEKKKTTTENKTGESETVPGDNKDKDKEEEEGEEEEENEVEDEKKKASLAETQDDGAEDEDEDEEQTEASKEKAAEKEEEEMESASTLGISTNATLPRSTNQASATTTATTTTTTTTSRRTNLSSLSSSTTTMSATTTSSSSSLPQRHLSRILSETDNTAEEAAPHLSARVLSKLMRNSLSATGRFVLSTRGGNNGRGEIRCNDISLFVPPPLRWEGMTHPQDDDDDERLRQVSPRHYTNVTTPPPPPWQVLIDQVLRKHVEYFVLETRIKYHYRWNPSASSNKKQEQQQQRFLLGVIVRRCLGELKMTRHTEGNRVDSLGTGVLGVHLLVFAVQIFRTLPPPPPPLQGTFRGGRQQMEKQDKQDDNDDDEETVATAREPNHNDDKDDKKADDKKTKHKAPSFAESLGIQVLLSPEPFRVRLGDEDELLTARKWCTLTSSSSRTAASSQGGGVRWRNWFRRGQTLPQEQAAAKASWPIFETSQEDGKNSKNTSPRLAPLQESVSRGSSGS